jgi:amino acid transporter
VDGQLAHAQLAHKLGLRDYFALAFGTMIGVGWLVLMDDWLGRGGPLGAMLAFAIGGVVLLPVGWVYGEWVKRLPDASGEAAYTAQVFPPAVSYFTGWMMLLAYFIVCPWEAVAVGKVAAYLVPSLNSVELYQVAGQPVFLPRLALGILMTVFLGVLNYRGIRGSATFQGWAAGTVLVIIALTTLLGAGHGSLANFRPGFRAGPLVSVLLVLQIVPYFMTGFESVAKCAEEASPEFRSAGFFRAIVMAIVVGALFYIIVIAAVAWVSPWQKLPSGAFSTAVAFERALHARWIVSVILSAALLSLFKVFNGNFVASSRLLFALGRRGMVEPRLGRVHPTNQTPAVAVVWVGIATAAIMLAGEAILVPITEVGSVASALGWMAACASYYRMRPLPLRRAVAVVGVVVAIGMVLMKALPFIPGHFSIYEWIAFAAWGALGWGLRRRPAASSAAA